MTTKMATQMSPAEIRLTLQNRRDAYLRQADAAEIAAETFARRGDDASLTTDARQLSRSFAQENATRATRFRREAEALAGALTFVPQFEEETQP